MAKKKKFKLKAHQKALILRQLQQASRAINLPAPSQEVQNLSTKSLDGDEGRIYAPITAIEDVRRSLKKVGVIVGIMVILLIIAEVVDQRFNYSLVIGQKIAKGLGI